MLDDLIRQPDAQEPLTGMQIRVAVEELIEPEVSNESKAGFLTRLAQRGETIEEITGFARELRARAVAPPLDPETRSGEILRSEEHTSELQSPDHLVCRLLLEKKQTQQNC